MYCVIPNIKLPNLVEIVNQTETFYKLISLCIDDTRHPEKILRKTCDYVEDMNYFSYLDAAQRNCEHDKNCKGILSKNCQKDKFYLCKSNMIRSSSDCMYAPGIDLI